MEADFWLKKWTDGQIGFHEADTHPMLLRHWDDLDLPADAAVFVPLCGKSLDMPWLRERGHAIVGVELSAIAVADFFAENGLEARRSREGAFERFEAPGYELWCGDFFELTAAQIGPVRAAYDRAALIALPPELRQPYVNHLATLLPPGSPALLVTLQYTQDLVKPPPFAVDDDEVARLYADYGDIERLGSGASTVKGEPCQETAFRLTRR